MPKSMFVGGLRWHGCTGMGRQSAEDGRIFARRLTAYSLALLWLVGCSGCAMQHLTVVRHLSGHVPVVRIPVLANKCGCHSHGDSCHSFDGLPTDIPIDPPRLVPSAGKSPLKNDPGRETHVDESGYPAAPVRSSAFVEEFPPAHFLPVPTRPVFGPL